MVEKDQPGDRNDENEPAGFEVVAIVHSDTATSGEEEKVHTVEAESAEKAEEEVKQKSGVLRVETSATEPFRRSEEGGRVYGGL